MYEKNICWQHHLQPEWLKEPVSRDVPGRKQVTCGYSNSQFPTIKLLIRHFCRKMLEIFLLFLLLFIVDTGLQDVDPKFQDHWTFLQLIMIFFIHTSSLLQLLYHPGKNRSLYFLPLLSIDRLFLCLLSNLCLLWFKIKHTGSARWL